MILYKNVDIIDLESILSKGILSLNESGNNNWDDGRRVNNSCDVVYMFKPITEENVFPKYGVALIEVDVPDEIVSENEIYEYDINRDKYIEYVTDRVETKYIQNIYIPEIFKDRIELPSNIFQRITWCAMKANHYGNNGIENCPDDVLKLFAETAKIMDSGYCNFFRGTTEQRTMIDLYNIQYIF